MSIKSQTGSNATGDIEFYNCNERRVSVVPCRANFRQIAWGQWARDPRELQAPPALAMGGNGHETPWE